MYTNNAYLNDSHIDCKFRPTGVNISFETV